MKGHGRQFSKGRTAQDDDINNIQDRRELILVHLNRIQAVDTAIKRQTFLDFQETLMISSQEMIYEQLAVSFRLSSLGVRLNSSAVQTLVFADPIRHSHYQFDLRGREVTNQLRGWRTIENSSAVLFRDQYLGLGKYLQTEYIRLTALIYIFLSIQWPS